MGQQYYHGLLAADRLCNNEGVDFKTVFGHSHIWHQEAIDQIEVYLDAGNRSLVLIDNEAEPCIECMQAPRTTTQSLRKCHK